MITRQSFSDTVSSSSPSGTQATNSYGTVLDTNTNRLNFYVQNVGSGGALYIKYGTGASSASYNLILKAASTLENGDGGSITDDIWKGPLSISGNSSFNKYISWELTP